MKILFFVTMMALIALFFVVPAAWSAWKGSYQGRTHRKRALQRRTFLNWLALPFVRGLLLLACWHHRVFGGTPAVALANELALMNEHGIETLTIDPASANLPVAQRYLLYKRGATGQNYCDLCGAANLPLGPSADSPYAVGDLVNIRRLGARPGFEIGIPSTAITVDDLVLTAAGGKVQAFTGIADGTYFVVGRCVKTVAAGALEVAYQPLEPVKITTANGVGTIVVA